MPQTETRKVTKVLDTQVTVDVDPDLHAVFGFAVDYREPVRVAASPGGSQLQNKLVFLVGPPGFEPGTNRL